MFATSIELRNSFMTRAAARIAAGQLLSRRTSSGSRSIRNTLVLLFLLPVAWSVPWILPRTPSQTRLLSIEGMDVSFSLFRKNALKIHSSIGSGCRTA